MYRRKLRRFHLGDKSLQGVICQQITGVVCVCARVCLFGPGSCFSAKPQNDKAVQRGEETLSHLLDK